MKTNCIVYFGIITAYTKAYTKLYTKPQNTTADCNKTMHDKAP